MEPTDVVLSDLPVAELIAAIRALPDCWVENLDYDFVDQHAEQVDAFFRRVIPQLPPGEAFEMAEQCQGHYVLGLSHLDARNVAADLLIGSTRRLLDSVADALADTEFLADGPDAGVSAATVQRLFAAADTLRRIDLTIEPPDPVA
ncbi:MAG: hypothetical protein Q4G46_06815 [Propionibacteriaceae bacterium]|nr:hypothetical protein [Propionibacteriaceae bacterium]